MFRENANSKINIAIEDFNIPGITSDVLFEDVPVDWRHIVDNKHNHDNYHMSQGKIDSQFHSTSVITLCLDTNSKYIIEEIESLLMVKIPEHENPYEYVDDGELLDAFENPIDVVYLKVPGEYVNVRHIKSARK